MTNLLISVSGIRGVVGAALTPEVASGYSAAFGAFLKKGRVAIGGDTRRTGPMVKSAAVAGLLSVGREVVDLGICPTPTVEIAVRNGKFTGGMAVTASHNPDRYNALKLIGTGGLFLSEKEGRRVNEIYESKAFKHAPWNKVGSLTHEDRWIETHIRKILDLRIIRPTLIRKSKLKIVVDCVGGTAAVMAPEFFSRLGVKFKLIHSEISGRFPRPPEPVPGHLGDLCREVRKLKADIGLAFDPDADRLAVVSEKGAPLGEEYTLALGSRFILKKTRGPVVVNLSSSLLNDFVAREAGVRLYRTKVGERNVTEKLKGIKGVVGGEGNGGLIYPELHWGRDGFLAAAVILQYLAESKSKISELAGELPSYAMLKRKISMSRREVSEKSEAVIRNLPAGKVDRRDGIKVYGDDWWVQLRSSNTEPITRLTAEAGSRRMAGSLLAAVESVLESK